jgi:hypothetical protein
MSSVSSYYEVIGVPEGRLCNGEVAAREGWSPQRHVVNELACCLCVSVLVISNGCQKIVSSAHKRWMTKWPPLQCIVLLPSSDLFDWDAQVCLWAVWHAGYHHSSLVNLELPMEPRSLSNHKTTGFYGITCASPTAVSPYKSVHITMLTANASTPTLRLLRNAVLDSLSSPFCSSSLLSSPTAPVTQLFPPQVTSTVISAA